jgi:peptidoglycan-associated lipoprotein
MACRLLNREHPVKIPKNNIANRVCIPGGEKMRIFPILMSLTVGLMLLSTGCSKKAMEADSGMEQQQAYQASQPQPEPIDIESQADTSSSALADQNAAQAAQEAKTLFLNAHIFFEFDSATLGAEAQGLLLQKAQWLFDNPGVTAVLIEGHCDERGTDAYNMALGSRRANVVKEYLMNLGVETSRLDTQSFGEEKPLVMGNDESAYAKNRRASFIIN